MAAQPAPVITRFEEEPAPGVKVSQISNLSKALVRALSVLSVRVVEIMPGKPVMGLEIPNGQREVMALSAITQASQYANAGSALTLAVGKDISATPVTADLSRMSHLLVAGTTGSGKSVAVNAMILSTVHKAPAESVGFIMIGPKMLELSVYEGIPHLLAPVVTDMKEAANYKKYKHPLPTWSTVNTWLTKSHAPRHHFEILLHLVLVIEIASLASATFRLIPAARPADTLPGPVSNSTLG